jgi:hypothetical protein
MRWSSLFALILVIASTSYAVGEALLGQWPTFRASAIETSPIFPDPTEAELLQIRRALLPKIEIEIPLEVRA